MGKYNNENGMALAYVLIVMAVLSILGVSALSITLAETKFSVNHQEQLENYNVAKSALDVAGRSLELMDKTESAYTTINVGDLLIDTTNFLDTGHQAIVEVIAKSNTKIQLKASSENESLLLDISVQEVEITNTSESITETTVTKTVPLAGAFAESIYAHDKLEFKSHAEIPAGTKLKNASDKGYPEHKVPALGAKKAKDLTITADGYYPDINKESVTIDTGTDATKTRLVIIDNITLNNKDHLTITGQGRLFLFVKSLDTNSGSSINASGDPKKLIVFLGNASVDGEADLKDVFQGYIYGIKASVTNQTPHNAFYGRIICDDYLGIANSEFDVAPPFEGLDNLGDAVTETITTTESKITFTPVTFKEYSYSKLKYTD